MFDIIHVLEICLGILCSNVVWYGLINVLFPEGE